MKELEDSGLTKMGPQTYRHYSGGKVAKSGRLWIATTAEGKGGGNHETVTDAIAQIESTDPCFWSYGKLQSIGDPGGVFMITGCLKGSSKDPVFVLYFPQKDTIPNFLKTVFVKHFLNSAKCVRCLGQMADFSTRLLWLLEFDEVSEQGKGKKVVRESNYLYNYVACRCGYPVWRLSLDAILTAQYAMTRASGWQRRKERLTAAEGKHSLREISEILELQGNRCFYCNKRFTKRTRSTKDHILPVVSGGGNWASNIVMACKSCNSSRCSIPFRTYCRLLSSEQNQRIILHLAKRILAQDLGNSPEETLVSLRVGLAQHNPNHRRYLIIRESSIQQRHYSDTNPLLPRTLDSVVKKAMATAKCISPSEVCCTDGSQVP